MHRTESFAEECERLRGQVKDLLDENRILRFVVDDEWGPGQADVLIENRREIEKLEKTRGED